MARLHKPITPQTIRQRRLEAQIPDLETLNRATIEINGVLANLEEGSELDFSLIQKGYPHTILEDLANVYRDAGWIVDTYAKGNQDHGLVIAFPTR